MCVDVELNMHTLEAQVRCFVGFGLLKMEEVKCVPMLIFLCVLWSPSATIL